MNNSESMARLSKFACEEKERSISTVVVKGGIGYATNGSLLVSETLDEPCDDIVSREDGKTIPVDSMIKFSKYPDAAEGWYRFPSREFGEFSLIFKEAFRRMALENERDYENRYKPVMCPCCNSDVYWDSYNDKIVSEREPKGSVGMSDVELPVRVVFQNKGFLDVNFGYVYRVFREYGNVMLSKANVEDLHGATLLFMKTSDEKMVSVLAPLRTYDDESVRGRIVRLEEGSGVQDKE